MDNNLKNQYLIDYSIWDSANFINHLRTHVIFNALIKLSNLTIRNPRQVSFFIILLRLILPGPEFHKIYRTFYLNVLLMLPVG